ncbi:unnamed protein product [Ceratitis capitata]|uniref:(Mediterranean fruit fly) hypothetical protein n=1 Tax=Ceratitis capitata TaxID=7213 RepID=A0A811VE00_CERCA|nr:unnamed protein product [Ceratitis capitata]
MSLTSRLENFGQMMDGLNQEMMKDFLVTDETTRPRYITEDLTLGSRCGKTARKRLDFCDMIECDDQDMESATEMGFKNVEESIKALQQYIDQRTKQERGLVRKLPFDSQEDDDQKSSHSYKRYKYQ